MVGVHYRHGKVLIHKVDGSNPENKIADKPSWSVDVREIIAMAFTGTLAILLALKEQYNYAMVLGTGLLTYATARTVPRARRE